MNATKLTRTLRITSRAATLAIHAGPQLEADYRID